EGYSTVNDVGIQFFRARGTKTAPSAILTNDILGFIEFHGHFGTGFDRGARIVASAPGTWSASSKPVDFVIEVVQSVSPFNKTPRFKILSDGSFEFRDSAASVIMPLKSNGVLGLKHSSGAAVPTINFFDGTIYSNTGIYSLSSGTVLGFSVSGTSYAEFSSSQFKLQTGIKLYIQYSGTASNPSILINNVGFFSPIAGNLSVTIGNTERYRFSNVGNLVMMGDYNFIPNTTGQGKVGTFTNKFAEVNAVVVNSGDFRFDNGYYLTEDYENGGIKLCRPDGSVVTSWR
ncbi:MAG: hypothetical protein QW303_07950, partial [Nitrososphaerota archaeon]